MYSDENGGFVSERCFFSCHNTSFHTWLSGCFDVMFEIVKTWDSNTARLQDESGVSVCIIGFPLVATLPTALIVSLRRLDA